MVYRDDVFLSNFQLTNKNVILYFRYCASSFYDKEDCNNEDLYAKVTRRDVLLHFFFILLHLLLCI